MDQFVNSLQSGAKKVGRVAANAGRAVGNALVPQANAQGIYHQARFPVPYQIAGSRYYTMPDGTKYEALLNRDVEGDHFGSTKIAQLGAEDPYQIGDPNHPNMSDTLAHNKLQDALRDKIMQDYKTRPEYQEYPFGPTDPQFEESDYGRFPMGWTGPGKMQKTFQNADVRNQQPISDTPVPGAYHIIKGNTDAKLAKQRMAQKMV